MAFRLQALVFRDSRCMFRIQETHGGVLAKDYVRMLLRSILLTAMSHLLGVCIFLDLVGGLQAVG